MEKKIGPAILLSILAFVLIVDIGGYMLIEQATFFDAVYMTVISITTVGFEEVFPLSPAGRLFTLFVIISGVALFFSLVVSIAGRTVEGRIRTILGRRKMKAIAKMKNHIIITGFGRMGKMVCCELDERNIHFVIIEKEADRFAMAEELGYPVLLGDATSEDILRKAGTDSAKTFISLLPTDAENLLTVITAREINPHLFLIARTYDPQNEKKLFKAGADRVISPHQLSSRRILNIVMKPNVVNLIDIATQSESLSLSLEEFTISDQSPLANTTIRESGIRENYDAMVVAVKRGEDMVFNPSPNRDILPGDLLILIGQKEKLIKIS